MKEEREFLQDLAVKKSGLLLVDDVLEAAKDPQCVLHKHFEWDDTEAARQYRREQARGLIQKCRVQMSTAPEVSIRAFVSLHSDQISGGGYRLTADVLDDSAMRAQLLHDIRLTIERWRRKLYLLEANVVDLIQQLEASVQNEVQRNEAAAYFTNNTGENHGNQTNERAL